MYNDFYFPSCGQGMIHGCRWEPEEKPKAVLQIVHGVVEYAARYDAFASWMAQRGFLVVAEDHMGHGGSIGPQDTPGYFSGGWQKAVADVHRLMTYTKAECSDVPYFILGHSMGSFLVRTLLIRYPKCDISGAVIVGTAWMHRGIINSGIASASAVCKAKGERYPSKFLNDMMFGSNNRRVEHKRTEFDWLNRDAAAVDAYIADPLCGFPATAGLIREMLTALRCLQEPEELKKMRKDLPVFFLSGGDDPVGGYGKGVLKAAEAFRDAGMEKVEVQLYPLCRHELLSEINKEEVWSRLLQWLEHIG